MLREEYDVHVDDEIFWTDGEVVTFVNRDVCQFKEFKPIAFSKSMIIVQSSGISLKAASIMQMVLLVA